MSIRSEDPVVDETVPDEDLFDPETDVLKDEGCLLREQDCLPCQEFVEEFCECFNTQACFGVEECLISAEDCDENQVFNADFCQCFDKEDVEGSKKQYFQDETVISTPSERAKDLIAEQKGLAYVVLGILIFLGFLILFLVVIKRLKGRK